MSYLGAKNGAGVYQAIISQFPPHDVFVDAFLGSGAILRRKPLCAVSYGVDGDRSCIDGFSCEGLGNVQLVHGDCREFLAGVDYVAGRVLVYADPPYLLSTRTSRHRYRYEFSERDHVELLELLKGLPSSVVISGYPAGLYDDLLSGWRTLEFQAMTRGGVRTEKLWMNFEHVPHWHVYAGRNFTDRQRIKRKAERWAQDFACMPPGERLAVLSGLLSTIAEDGDAAG